MHGAARAPASIALAVSEIMSMPIATRSPISTVRAFDFDRVGEGADLGAQSWFGRPRCESATRRALAGLLRRVRGPF